MVWIAIIAQRSLKPPGNGILSFSRLETASSASFAVNAFACSLRLET